MNVQEQNNQTTQASEGLASGNPWNESPPGETSQTQAAAAEAKPVGETKQAATTTEQTAQKPSAPSLTPEQIAQIVSQSVAGAVPVAVAKATPQPEATQEDFDKAFNVFKPTAELLAKVGLPATPEAAAIFQNEIVIPIVRQASTLASYQLQKLKQELVEQFTQSLKPFEPVKQFAQQQAADALKARFFEKHSDLKAYEPLVIVARDRLIGQGKTNFKSEDEAIEAVAAETRTLLATLPGATQQTSQQTQTNGATHRMSALSGAGQGGAGSRGGAKPKSTSEALWGDS